MPFSSESDSQNLDGASDNSSGTTSLDVRAEAMINEAYSRLRLGTSRREELDRKLFALHQQKIQKLSAAKNECTFRPKINKNSSAVTEAAFSVPVEERLQRDAELRETRRLAATKSQSDQPEKLYTFKPQINSSSRKTASEMNPTGIPVEDRLMHYAEAMEESRFMLADQQRREEEAHLKQFFNPKIKARDFDQSKDFFERLEEAELRKKLTLEEQREQLNSAHPFKPQLSRISVAYVEGRRQFGFDHEANRSDALYNEAKIRQQSHADRKAQIEESENDSRYYKPSTCRINNEILQAGKLKELYGQTTFVERQQVFMELAKRHAEQLKQDVENDERHRKPCIPGVSSGGCETEKLDEIALQEQVERLYTHHKTSKTLKKVLAEKEINAKCPFKPTLAPATEEYWRTLAERNSETKGTIFDRLASAPAKSHLEKQGLNDSVSVASNEEKKRRVNQTEVDEFYRKQLSGLQRKEHMIKKQKLLQEIEGQKDCTFHPDIQVRPTPMRPSSAAASHNTSVCSATSVKELVGVSSFVERQASARRRRQEDEERLSQLGKGKPCNGPNFTVVTPFKLSRRSSSENGSNHRQVPRMDDLANSAPLRKSTIYRTQSANSKKQQPSHGYPYATSSRFNPGAVEPGESSGNSLHGPPSPPFDSSANTATINPNLGNSESLSYDRNSAPLLRATVRVPVDERRRPQYVDPTPQSATLLQAAMKRYLSSTSKTN